MAILALILSLILPPCASEDSSFCYWDASTRGNGEGTSFVALGDWILPLD